MLLGGDTGIGPIVVPPDTLPRPGHPVLDVEGRLRWQPPAQPVPNGTDVRLLRRDVHAAFNAILPAAVEAMAANPVIAHTLPCSAVAPQCLVTPALAARLRAGAACGVSRELARTTDPALKHSLGLWRRIGRPVRVAMHVRRGDIALNRTVARPGHENRFVPDEYYFDIARALEKVLPGLLDILVFTEPPRILPRGVRTETARAEDFYPHYLARGLTVHLPRTADILTTTAHFAAAHIMVQGRSTLSLSLTPFSRGCVTRVVDSGTHSARELLIPIKHNRTIMGKQVLRRWLRGCLPPELVYLV